MLIIRFSFLILGFVVATSVMPSHVAERSDRSAWMDRRLTGKRYVKKMLAQRSLASTALRA